MQSEPSSSLANRLREAVLPGHRRIEALPFFTALAGRTLGPERYLDQLRAMAIVETTLHHAVEMSDDRDVRKMRSAWTSRSDLLMEDLAFFDRRGPLPDDPAPTREALALAREILITSAVRPSALIGYLYVFQGMSLGNLVHKEDACACAGGAAGAKWYAGQESETAARFRAFSSALNALELDGEASAAITSAAATALTDLERLHAALDPGATPERRFLATTFNPEAGDHAVPTDPAVVTAALRAGERCIEEFPYFLERWGERGRRYTQSDVAWLASLAALTPDEVLQQVHWLAGVLARRGMPSLLLERQLLLLEEELSAACTSGIASLAGGAARHLSARRQAILPDSVAGPLAASFVSSALHGPEAERLRVACLLLSAVADEASGLAGAVTTIRSWYQDARFPASWITAVDVLLRAAVAAISTEPRGG